MHHSWLPYVLHAPLISFFLILITRIIFGEEYRTRSSFLCSLLHSPLNSSLLCPNMSQHPILEHPQHKLLS
jgi:hypothetical protein